MKLIDGDKLKEMLHTAAIPMTEYGRGVQTGYQYACAFIDNMPAAEAEPVRHGRWEERSWEDMKAASCIHTIASARCSECGLWCEEVRDWTARVEYRFCPSCGARMDGDLNADD